MTTGLDGYTATAAADGARSLIHALHRLLGESAALRDIEDDLEGADADTRHSVHVFIETRAAWRTAAGLVGEIDQALRDAGLDLNDAARLSDAPSPYGRARQLVRELEEDLTPPEEVALALAELGIDVANTALQYGESRRQVLAARLSLSERRIALEHATRPLVRILAATPGDPGIAAPAPPGSAPGATGPEKQGSAG